MRIGSLIFPSLFSSFSNKTTIVTNGIAFIHERNSLEMLLDHLLIREELMKLLWQFDASDAVVDDKL